MGRLVRIDPDLSSRIPNREHPMSKHSLQELFDLIEGLDEEGPNYRQIREAKILKRTIAKDMEDHS